jgi:hypothetical protein
MAPRIVVLGAAAGVAALLMALATFFMPLPFALKVFLYFLFGGLFLASVAIFGRILVMAD